MTQMHRALILLAGATAFRGPITRRRPLVAPRQAAAIFEQKKGGAALSPEAKAILKQGEAHLKRVNDLDCRPTSHVAWLPEILFPLQRSSRSCILQRTVMHRRASQTLFLLWFEPTC